MSPPSDQAQRHAQFLASVQAAWRSSRSVDPLVRALVDVPFGRAIFALTMLELEDDTGLVCALLRAAGRCGVSGGRLVFRNVLRALLRDPSTGVRDAVVGLCEACQLQDLASDLAAAAEVELQPWLADKMRSAAEHLGAQ